MTEDARLIDKKKTRSYAGSLIYLILFDPRVIMSASHDLQFTKGLSLLANQPPS